MVRSVDEIVERLKKIIEDDWGLAWEFSGKIIAQFLPRDVLEELGFEVVDDYEPYPLTEEEILCQMKEYFPFAVSKVCGCRGISASRSIDHYIEWIWLLGDDEFLEKLKKIDYAPYGKPKLIAIAKRYGFDKEFPEDYNKLLSFNEYWCE